MTTEFKRVEAQAAMSADVRRSSQLARGLAALGELSDGPKSASEVASRLDVNRSTALRLLQELTALGYVVRDPQTLQFATVSARIWTLIASSQGHLDWSEVVNPILSSIRDEFGEAAVLGVPAAGTMVYMAFFPSRHQVAVSERLGTVRYMNCSAIGKAYLASLTPSALAFELSTMRYDVGTEKAAHTPTELQARLGEIREKGYAVDRDETAIGATCVATAVWVGDSLIGAAGISGPTWRLSDDLVEAIGRRCVTEFSRIRQTG